MISEGVAGAWAEFQAHSGSLFDLLTCYADAWEEQNQPDLNNPDVEPHEMLTW